MKNFIKKIPYIGDKLVTLKRKRDCLIRSRELDDRINNFERITFESSSNPQEISLVQVRNLLSYSTLSGKLYAGDKFPGGYQTISILGTSLLGQRDPVKRLSYVPLDFTGKRILDIGCNQGGMLLSINEQAKWCVGLDYDQRLINAANKVRSVRGSANVDFFAFDVEKEPIDLICDFLPESKVDIVFLLAMCMWIKNWKELITFCSSISPLMLFESNGSDIQQSEQVEFLGKVFDEVSILNHESNDDQLHSDRKLYLARKL